MAFMKAPEFTTSASVGGQEFEVKNGIVEVPDEFAPDLVAHGFIVVEKPEEKPKK